MNPAIFLDRDGVLVADAGLMTKAAEIQILSGVPEALASLKASGFKLIVVSNQAVVARGLITEEAVDELNREIEKRLIAAGGVALDGWYICPHHPKATLAAFRKDCECRKPRPGMLLRAAAEHRIDLSASFMIGDRITDIIAGKKAGCRAILVETGAHLEPPIETAEPLDENISPDLTCNSLSSAADAILKES